MKKIPGNLLLAMGLLLGGVQGIHAQGVELPTLRPATALSQTPSSEQAKSPRRYVETVEQDAAKLSGAEASARNDSEVFGSNLFYRYLLKTESRAIQSGIRTYGRRSDSDPALGWV